MYCLFFPELPDLLICLLYFIRDKKENEDGEKTARNTELYKRLAKATLLSITHVKLRSDFQSGYDAA